MPGERLPVFEGNSGKEEQSQFRVVGAGNDDVVYRSLCQRHRVLQDKGVQPGWDMTPVNPWESGASSLGFDFSSYPSLPLLFHHKLFNTSLWRASTFVATCRSDLIDTMKKSI